MNPFIIVLLVYVALWLPLIRTMRGAIAIEDTVGVFEVVVIPVVGFVLGCILGKFAYGAFLGLNDWASSNIFLLLIVTILLIVVALAGVITGFYMIATSIGVWAWLALIPIA